MVLGRLLNWLGRCLKQSSSPSCYRLGASQSPAKETMLRTVAPGDALSPDSSYGARGSVAAPKGSNFAAKPKALMLSFG